MAQDFIGVKLALLLGDQLVLIQRDDKPGLRYAGLWDFPGGGREGNETPFECAARETQEELGIVLHETNVVWQRSYPAMHDASLRAEFMVVKVSQNDVDNIVFGDEGQGWKLVGIKEFLAMTETIENLKVRLQDYLAAMLI